MKPKQAIRRGKTTEMMHSYPLNARKLILWNSLWHSQQSREYPVSRSLCFLRSLSGSKWCSESVICYQRAICDGHDRRALNKYLQLSGTETWWGRRWKEISQIGRGQNLATKGGCKFRSFWFLFSKLWSNSIIQINNILVFKFCSNKPWLN